MEVFVPEYDTPVPVIQKNDSIEPKKELRCLIISKSDPRISELEGTVPL